MNEEVFLGELRTLFPQTSDVALGPGDDCAAVRFPGRIPENPLLLLAADQVIENIHFLPDASPEAVGEKLVKRNVSDVAAMGGKPLYALLCCAMFPMDHEWLVAFHRGVRNACEKYGLCVTGGDVSALPARGKVFSLSIVGSVENSCMKTRSGAEKGDCLYATGKFGGSFESGRHMTFEPRLAEGIFLGKSSSVHAMLDVSDGLLKDALRIADASGCSLFLEYGKIPLNVGASLSDALCDGEDYELLFAVDRVHAEELEKNWNFAVSLSRIGEFRDKISGGTWANPVPLSKEGFDHFHENI